MNLSVLCLHNVVNTYILIISGIGMKTHFTSLKAGFLIKSSYSHLLFSSATITSLP